MLQEPQEAGVVLKQIGLIHCTAGCDVVLFVNTGCPERTDSFNSINNEECFPGKLACPFRIGRIIFQSNQILVEFCIHV